MHAIINKKENRISRCDERNKIVYRLENGIKIQFLILEAGCLKYELWSSKIASIIIAVYIGKYVRIEV